jgi:hypothetical protein
MQGRKKMTMTVRVRVNEVVRMILDDPRAKTATGKELIELISEMFGVGYRQAERYLNRARDEITKIMKDRNESALENALSDRAFLLEKALGVTNEDGKQITPPNYYLYLEVVKDRDRLLGLYPVKQAKEVVNKNVDMKMFTIHGLDRLANGDPLEEVLQDKNAIIKQLRG